MLNNMTIKSRLIFVISFLSLLLAIVGGLGMYSLNETNQSFKGVYEDRTVPLGDLGMVLDRMQRTRLNAAIAAYARKPDLVKERQNMTNQRDAEIAGFWQKYMATRLTPEEASIAENFMQQWNIYAESRNRTMVLAAAGDYDAAVVNMIGDAAAKFDAAHAGMLKLLEFQRTESQKQYEMAQDSFETISMFTSVTMVLGIFLAVLIGVVIIRAILKALNEAINIANAVASGDLTSQIDVTSTNETGRLMQALKTMNDNLTWSSKTGQLS